MKTLKYLLLTLAIFILCFDLKAQDVTAEEIYEKASQSIFIVYGYDEAGGLIAQGSAVSVSADGIIYTNFHVYRGCSRFVLKNNNIIIDNAVIIGADPFKDLLILKAELETLNFVTPGNSDIVKPGQVVYALGNPKGYTLTFSKGMVSCLRPDNENEMYHIQCDVSISPGSSGGALLNSDGELIGITCSGVPTGNNINFAVPVNEFKNLFTVIPGDSQSVFLMSEFAGMFSGLNFENEWLPDEFSKLAALMICNKENCYLVAKTYQSFSEYDSCIAWLSRAIDAYGPDKKLLRLRAEARTFGETGTDGTDALADINYAILLDTNDAVSYFKRGMLNEFLRKDFAAAIDDYKKYKELNPDYSYVNMIISECYLKINDTVSALNTVPLTLYSPDLIAYDFSDAAKLYARLGKSFDAIDCYTWALEKDPYNTEYLFARAVQYTKTEMYEEAINDYWCYLSIEPMNCIAYTNMAYNCLRIKDYDEAKKYFTKSISLNGHYFNSYVGLSIISYIEKDLKSSKKFILKSAETESWIKKGMEGLEILSKQNGYFWTMQETDILKKIFGLVGFKKENKIEPELNKRPISKSAKPLNN